MFSRGFFYDRPKPQKMKKYQMGPEGLGYHLWTTPKHDLLEGKEIRQNEFKTTKYVTS